MSEQALRAEEREAILEAAPFAALAAVALGVLAAVSAHAGWEFDGVRWRMWAATACVWAVLAVVLLLGLGPMVPQRHDARRRIIEVLLGVVVAFSVGQTALLVSSLVAGSEGEPTGPQLLHSGATLWLSNVIAFGLTFWVMDDGGPANRAVAAERRTPDFAFPQDQDREIARAGWAPRLADYLYVAFTNSIAFSPTDTMPLTRPAKGLMALESAVSVVALLLVAARAINILG